MTDKVSFKNPVIVWVEVYYRVLEEKYDSNIKNLIKDEIGMYILKRLLDLMMEDCTGVKHLPLGPPDGYDEYGKIEDLKDCENKKKMIPSVMKRLLFSSSLDIFVNKSLYGCDDYDDSDDSDDSDDGDDSDHSIDTSDWTDDYDDSDDCVSYDDNESNDSIPVSDNNTDGNNDISVNENRNYSDTDSIKFIDNELGNDSDSDDFDSNSNVNNNRKEISELLWKISHGSKYLSECISELEKDNEVVKDDSNDDDKNKNDNITDNGIYTVTVVGTNSTTNNVNDIVDDKECTIDGVSCSANSTDKIHIDINDKNNVVKSSDTKITNIEDFYELPTSYCRSTYATSLLSKENIEEFKKFSNNHIWEHIGGSGYNAWLCKQMGINIYCTDHKGNYFESEYVDDKRYANVHDEISDEEVKKIIANDGAMMYIWPSKKYHNLEKWIKLGGKKIIIVADHNPNHMYVFKKIKELSDKAKKDGKKLDIMADGFMKEIIENAPLICPIFPYENEWKLVKTMEVPQYESVNDYAQFWVRK